MWSAVISGLTFRTVTASTDTENHILNVELRCAAVDLSTIAMQALRQGHPKVLRKREIQD